MNAVAILNAVTSPSATTDLQALARMDTLAYGQRRDASAKALGVSVLILDKAVREAQAQIRKEELERAAVEKGVEESPQLRYAKSIGLEGSYCKRGGVVFRWMDTHWEAQNGQNGKELESAALHFLVECAADKVSEKLAQSAVATAALYLPELPAPAAVLQHTPIVPTRDGYLIVNHNQVTLRPADKADGITYVLSCGYDPFATCPRFNTFLVEALPDQSMRDYLQEYLGYTLLSDTRHEIAAWLIGEGGTGKGTVGVVAQGLHRRVVAIDLEHVNSFTMACIVDASLVYIDETPRRKIPEQIMKSAISGDRMSSDVKNRDPISFAPTAKWLINGNHLPPLSDHSTGFWRRFIIFPFSIKPKVRIPCLGETIVETELEGVLNWALAGLQRLLKRGSFAPLPEVMQRIKDEAIVSANSVASWADECEVKISEDGGLSSKDDAYQYYRRWAARNGLGMVSNNTFWERMPTVVPRLVQSRPRINGRQVPSANLTWPPEVAAGLLFAQTG